MKNLKFESGQVLVSLLFFMIIAIAVTSSAIIVSVINAQTTSAYEQTDVAYAIAEAGVENALVRLLRDPSYTGETLSLNGGSSLVQVSGVSPVTILSEGKIGTFLRKIQVQASYTNTTLTITSWKEIL